MQYYRLNRYEELNGVVIFFDIKLTNPFKILAQLTGSANHLQTQLSEIYTNYYLSESWY
jgi:hypothetical protein